MLEYQNTQSRWGHMGAVAEIKDRSCRVSCVITVGDVRVEEVITVTLIRVSLLSHLLVSASAFALVCCLCRLNTFSICFTLKHSQQFREHILLHSLEAIYCETAAGSVDFHQQQLNGNKQREEKGLDDIKVDGDNFPPCCGTDGRSRF